MTAPLRIGNASGFYGDRFSAVREMLDGGPLDILTGDYLAELTMGILARDRQRDAGTGYAKTFLRQMETCLGLALDRGVTIVVNAGGVNPAGLAAALTALAERLGLADHLRCGYVTGDALGRQDAIAAHAYLGAFGIAECLRGGANVVVTGRVTDASLVVGPSIAHFGWGRGDFDALAGATVAGHILECGPQSTGGNYAFFGEIADRRRPGFPIAEMAADGSAVITKHAGTGGAVTVGTATAQLLYEVGAPACLGPDVVTHLDTIALTQLGPDRVGVSGVSGSPPPRTLKLGVTRLGGYRNTMTFVLCGLDIPAKADLVRDQIADAIGTDGIEFDLVRTDHPDPTSTEIGSALLHVHIRDTDGKRAARAFSRAAVELALSSYPGMTLTTPPTDATPYAVFSDERIPQAAVEHVAVRPNGERVRIPPPTVTAPPTVAAPPSAEPAAATEPERTEPPTGATSRRPLGDVVGARSGDKGGDANLGLWVRTDDAYAWLRATMSTDRLRDLVPEAATLDIDRYELPNLRALNFVLHGLLGEGVGASTRFDPQAKALGELVRARIVDLPADLR
jgi:hypothetical protein